MNLVARVKGILLNPRQEWAVIDAEPFNQSAILTGYVLPLAAIGPIASVIGWTVFGLGFGIRLGVGAALTGAITAFILAIVGLFVAAYVTNALAPSFNAQQSFGQAFKLIVYSSTAAWIGGIFQLIPALAIIGALFGLYSLYLLFIGMPIVMKAPQDKAVIYTIAVIVVVIIVYWVALALTRRIMY
jgi:high-affinity Fe2+/Pb2+ permease